MLNFPEKYRYEFLNNDLCYYKIFFINYKIFFLNFYLKIIRKKNNLQKDSRICKNELIKNMF